MKASATKLPRTESTLRQASTKTVKEGTYYCADSHMTGFGFGIITTLFILSLINAFSPFIAATAESAVLAASAAPWGLGVAFVHKLLASYPYFMNGTKADGALYADVSPESISK